MNRNKNTTEYYSKHNHSYRIYNFQMEYAVKNEVL